MGRKLTTNGIKSDGYKKLVGARYKNDIRNSFTEKLFLLLKTSGKGVNYLNVRYY